VSDELTYDKLKTVMDSLKPAPRMPRWKDLTWAQRNMVEREIAATESQFVRDAMREAFYCADDDCQFHGDPAARQHQERGS
jgi:hypothetical protein